MNWEYRLALWLRCKWGLHEWKRDYLGPWFFRCEHCGTPLKSGPGAMARPV